MVDDKGRASFPAAFKKLLKPEDEDTIVMTRGIHDCIFAYPKSAWQYYMRTMQRMKVPADDRLKVMRIMLSWAVNCTFDPQGRVRIPPHLADKARIKRDIIITGHKDRIEIWDKNLYEAYHDDGAFDYNNAATQLFVEMMPGTRDDEYDWNIGSSDAGDRSRN